VLLFCLSAPCDCHRKVRLSRVLLFCDSRTFLRQSHFLATVWTGLYWSLLNSAVCVRVCVVKYSCLGTVENHGKKWHKTRHTFVKIAKSHGNKGSVCIAANLLKLMVSNSRKIYILGKIHATMSSRSHIPPVSNKAHGLW